MILSIKKTILFFFVLALVSCQFSKENESPKRPKPTRKYDKPQDFTYSIWSLKNDSIRKVFKSNFSNSQINTILSLNRIDRNALQKADSLIVPDKLDDDFLAYAPFPYTLEKLFDVPKIALFSYELQAYGLYEYGELIRWGPSSMGSKTHQTPTGLFFCNWKGEEVQSTVDDEWLLRWNFNIENEEGIGWHQYELPGYPASHSCLRLLESDAKWMYDWAEEWILKDANTVIAKGTPVIIFGEYAFDGKSISMKLIENSKGKNISENDLDILISKHLTEIMKEQENREKVMSKKQ